MGFFFFKKLGAKDSNGTSYQSFENGRFLGWVMVRVGMKVSFGASLFSIDLVGKGTIRSMGDENIKEGKSVLIFNFHGKLDMRGNVVKMVKERVK
jgi:hypothetical protein